MSDTRNPKRADVDPDAPPSAEELAAAESLRGALDDASKPSDDAELLRALSLAETPRELDPDAQKKLVDAALVRFDRRRSERSGVVIRVAFGAAALVAAAAAVLLLVGRPPAQDAAALARSRSTQPLFGEPFKAGEGQASSRIDRIAVARSSDFRENRFKRWGVR